LLFAKNNIFGNVNNYCILRGKTLYVIIIQIVAILRAKEINILRKRHILIKNI